MNVAIAVVLASALAASPSPDAGTAPDAARFPGFKALELVRMLEVDGGTPPPQIAVAESDGSGGFFVGGSFDEVNRRDAPTLVHIDSNGSMSPWTPPAPLLPSAMALGTSDATGTALYVAADTAVPENRGLVVLDAALGRRLSASPYGFRQITKLAISFNRMLAVDSDGSKSGEDAIQLRDLDGSNGRTVPVSGGRVHSVLPSGDGFFVGGEFTKIGNAKRNGVALIDGDGAVTPFNAGLEPGTDVYTIAATSSRVFVGGHLRVPPPRGQKLDLRDIMVFARSGQRMAPITGLDVHIVKELAVWERYLFAASFGGWDAADVQRVKFVAIDTETSKVVDTLETEGPSTVIAISGDRLLLGHRLYRLPLAREPVTVDE